MNSALILVCACVVALPAIAAESAADEKAPPAPAPAEGKAVSAKADPKTAYTDPSHVDADFPYVGEYVGEVKTMFGNSQRIGLQVYALGDGTFAAKQYAGGLPGERSKGGAVIPLQGKRDGGTLKLEGWPLEIDVFPDYADSHYNRGGSVGHLLKVERKSPTLGACPPCGAQWLFNGTNTACFKNGKMTADGYLMAGTETLHSYQDFTLHLEFRLPYMPYARGQGRANSGVYLQKRYEVQILDSFGLEGEDNECGGLYRFKKPDVNMCFPPLAWQTYDIEYRAARFDCDGNKVCNARVTVCHNGVSIHNDVELTRKTGGGSPEGPEALPILLQNHGNPVVFRNIWIVDHCNPCGCCCCGACCSGCCW